MLRLGVHNDKGTPDIECLLSQWRMLYYNKTCMEYGSSHKAQSSSFKSLRDNEHSPAPITVKRSLAEGSQTPPTICPDIFQIAVLDHMPSDHSFWNTMKYEPSGSTKTPNLSSCIVSGLKRKPRDANRFWNSMRYLPQMSECSQKGL